MREAFCVTCARTVYRGSGQDDACPVCSSPLVVTSAAIEDGPTPLEASNREQRRMAAVHRYEILDSPPDGAFDRIAKLAARIFEVPIATITIVDEDRIWFKAKHGIDAEQIGRDPGLCASAVLGIEPWIVNDAASDPRTLSNPLVRGELGLRFYAAVPLTTADGYSLGTINIIDTQPREMTAEQIDTLELLAALVVDELELRLQALRIHREGSLQAAS